MLIGIENSNIGNEIVIKIDSVFFQVTG